MRKVERGILRSRRGGVIDLDTPDVGAISIEDIALGLSHVCRWAGQSKVFYSVAAHSIAVSELIEWTGGTVQEQLAGLLHDASEAYLSDIPSPVKQRSTSYKRIEAKIQTLIYNKFNLPTGKMSAVKWADDEILNIEQEILFSFDRRVMQYSNQFIEPRCRFLNRFMDLYTKYQFEETSHGKELLRKSTNPS